MNVPTAVEIETDAGAVEPAVPVTGAREMSLWRLEWLRLVRTKRLFALFAVYVFFGLTSPALARYMGELLDRFGGGVQIVTKAPTPIDGLVTYTSNVNQIGLLVFALVVSGAVAFDAQREMAVFLRTRVAGYRALLVPKYVMTVGAGVLAYFVGVLVCWYGTILLLDGVDAVGVLTGAFLGALYLAFIGAVAAVLGSRLDSVVTTAVGTLGIALALGIVGTIGGLGSWLPSNLLGALTALAGGGEPSAYAKAIVVTVVATIALLAVAARSGDRREL